MSLDDWSQPRHISSTDPPVGCERSVLVRIGDGDGDALLELRWRWGEWICARLYHITHDWLSASLLTVGVFMCLWRNPVDFDPGGLRHSLLSLAERRARQWVASTAEDTDMPGVPEKSTLQLAAR
jgi:hypothetical protein